MPYFETSAGRLFAAQRGKQGPMLLYIHGAGGSHEHWGYQMQGLAAVARQYAVDLPGHGRSPGSGLADVAAYAALIPALLTSIGAEQVLLAGHSMGGTIALQAALNYPAQVAGLILVGSSARMPVAPTLLEGLADDPQPAIEFFTQNLYGPQAPPDMVAATAEAYRQIDAALLRNDLLACNAFDVRRHLGRIHCPVLVLCGEADRMTPLKFSVSLSESLPNARLHSIPTAGHMLMLEAAAPVNAAMREFISSVSLA
jgi:pimeloyl-ACP methyl ester carboxylesterase